MDRKGSSDRAHTDRSPASPEAVDRTRIACVDLPAFPLQILVRRHPDWREAPAVVVDKDKPQGIILWSNERARAFRILPGMRYAAALSLARDLRADVIEMAALEREIAALVECLQRFTPNVEPCAEEPGVFWLDASGLSGLYPSLGAWGAAVRDALAAAEFDASVAVGFTRMGTYAIAKTNVFAMTVFDDVARERREAARVPLARLGMEPRLRESLAHLGITTLGRFARLPRAGVKRRFGTKAYALHRLAGGDLVTPLSAAPHAEPLREEILLDFPEHDIGRIVLVVETLLDALVTRLAARNESLAAVTTTLGFELRGERRTETLRPAAPTRDRRQILQLIALRLGTSFAASRPTSGVVEVVLDAEGTAPADEQLDLFAEKPRRDLAAASRALARLRAELGEESVVRARLREGHLPEARVTWEPMRAPRAPEAREVGVRPLVRRMHDRPVPLPPRPRHEPDGWLVAGLAAGPVREALGPYVVSGGWWMRRVERRYHYVRTADGSWLWVYEDMERRRWFLQGAVE